MTNILIPPVEKASGTVPPVANSTEGTLQALKLDSGAASAEKQMPRCSQALGPEEQMRTTRTSSSSRLAGKAPGESLKNLMKESITLKLAPAGDNPASRSQIENYNRKLPYINKSIYTFLIALSSLVFALLQDHNDNQTSLLTPDQKSACVKTASTLILISLSMLAILTQHNNTAVTNH